MPINFIKFHGLGNDYIVIESDQLKQVSDLGDFAKRICNRHYGAGSDGIAIVGEPASSEANFNVRIFNPDGSEANLSGNGTRCAVAYLYYQGLWSADRLLLSTRSGLKRYLLLERNGGKFLFESDLGQPGFTPESIPMSVDSSLSKVIGYPLTSGTDTFSVTAVQVGNPICCIFVNDFDELDWRRIGKELEIHPQFPERANVVFVRVDNRQQIELRIWERGVGETTASGSCSCGGALAAMVNDKTDREVRVVTEGGEVKVKWSDDDQVVITGTAEVVYSGAWPS
jgi:diaminopimelate epimerase